MYCSYMSIYQLFKQFNIQSAVFIKFPSQVTGRTFHLSLYTIDYPQRCFSHTALECVTDYICHISKCNYDQTCEITQGSLNLTFI